MSALKLLDLENIVYFKADGSYTNVYLTNGKTLLLSERLGRIEKKIISKCFFRCHKSFLVNTEQIKSVQMGSQTYLTMCNNHTVKVSHRKTTDFKNLMKTRYLVLRCKKNPSTKN